MNILKSLEDKVDIPLEDKLKKTEEIIKKSLERSSNPLVGWSGGKSSTVLLYLVRKFKPDIKVIFHNTGVEFPETLDFIKRMKKEWDLNLFITKPWKKNFWDVIKEYGWPEGKHKYNEKGFQGRYCVYYLKEKPLQIFCRENSIDLIFDGISFSESRHRMFLAEKFGYEFYAKKFQVLKVRPLIYWNEEDVWDFINENGIPYNPLYDKGVKRTGCMTCTAYKSWKENLSKANPRMLRIILEMKDGQRTLD